MLCNLQKERFRVHDLILMLVFIVSPAFGAILLSHSCSVIKAAETIYWEEAFSVINTHTNSIPKVLMTEKGIQRVGVCPLTL